MTDSFRQRVLGRERLLGTFVKTPAPQIVELAALSGLDFVVLDAEHAPFDRSALDLAIMAGRGAKLAVMVRVPGYDSELVGASLDLGASGIVVPHVGDASIARRAVSPARFSGGARGLSPSVRAGGYGAMPFAEYAALADEEVTIWAQIEEPIGIENVDDILTVTGVDCLFVGRVDLAFSCGKTSVDDQYVVVATQAVCQSARRTNKAAAVFVKEIGGDSAHWSEQGATVFVCGSDQAVLRGGFAAMRDVFLNQAD